LQLAPCQPWKNLLKLGEKNYTRGAQPGLALALPIINVSKLKVLKRTNKVQEKSDSAVMGFGIRYRKRPDAE